MGILDIIKNQFYVNDDNDDNDANPSLEQQISMDFDYIAEVGFGDDVDTEKLEELKDDFLNNYEDDLSFHNLILLYYSLYSGWDNSFKKTKDNFYGENYDSFSDDEKEKLEQSLKDKNEKALYYIDEAIVNIQTEEDYDEWMCHFTSCKIEAMRRRDIICNAETMLETTRMAIKALPYAPNDNEKEWAKSFISGIPDGFKKTITQMGYGLEGRTYEERIKANFLTKEDFDKEKDPEMKELMQLEIEDFKKEVANGQSYFYNRPYHDRQFIFIVRDLDHIGGCYDDTDNIKYVFPINEMPIGITFPLGHPQPNTLYYAHPLRPMYLPVENAPLLLFYEKIQEICRLFQCLGATEITTRSLKGHKVSQTENIISNLEVNAGYKIAKVSGSINKKSSNSESRENRDEMSLTQTFSPNKDPYCPDDLLWAKEDPEIQTFIRQRLDGGLLTFTKRVSSLETMIVSNSQMADVKAAFEYFMVYVSPNYSSETDTTFSEITETEWEISVMFKPIDELKKESAKLKISEATQTKESPTLTENEQAYLEELKFAYEDNAIGDTERRFLERKRTKLGLSVERAAELEASLNNISLTDDEKEYMELYKEYAAVGEITDRVRRLLNREAKSLGISDDRVKEIENSL